MANQANLMINEGQSKIFTVSVAQFNGSVVKPAKPDTNQLMPVVLPSIDGNQLPENARVISGTVAQRSGLEVGKSYQISVTNAGPGKPYIDKETGEEKVGTQYNYQVLHTLSFKDLRDIQNEQSSVSVSAKVKAENPFA